ncbi:MAG: aminotransferase class IV [Deltaproteobacteria bacterium]|nr:aminotransferase class IV [Deltaproteobacteria bacterium]
MSTIININGKYYTKSNAKISVFDRGFLFGDSIFEVVRTYRRDKILALDMHLDRLYKSAEFISLKLKRKGYIEKIIRDTIKKGNNKESYVRLIITRGVSREIGMDPHYAVCPNYIVIVKNYRPPPANPHKRSVSAAIVSVKRNHKEALNPLIKSGNYLNNVLAHIDAMKRGGTEAIMVNSEGYIAEGTTFNVFMVKNGVYYTPPVDAGILDGITRKILLKLMKESNIKFLEKMITPSELLNADEVFFTSTLREIQPVVKINDRKIGNGVVGAYTVRLLEIFNKNLHRFLS